MILIDLQPATQSTGQDIFLRLPQGKSEREFSDHKRLYSRTLSSKVGQPALSDQLAQLSIIDGLRSESS